MKESIIKITLWAFMISAITLCCTHEYFRGMELSRIASFYRDEAPTQLDDNEGGSGVDYSNAYASNHNSYAIENSYTQNSFTTDHSVYEKTDIPSQNIAFNHVSNENSTNNIAANIAKEYGPNNNYQDETSAAINNNEAATANQLEATKSTSNSNLSKEVDWSTKEITTNLSPTVAPPPGGGGLDPFSAPFDDFYGLAFLLLISTFFGIFGLKKMKIA